MVKQSALKRMSVSTLTKIATLSGLAFALTFLKINLPVFPEFLDLELSDVPQILAVFSCGTIPALFVLIIKNLLMLLKTSSLGIGVLANFVVGFAYLLPFALIYAKVKSHKGFILGAVAGTVSMTAAACIFNYYVLIPAYTTVLEIPMEAILGMAKEVNKNVTDLGMLIVYAIAPFNILKAILFSICSYLLYRVLQPALKFL